MFPIRYLIYVAAAVGSAMIGSLNTSINFAWVCMVNGTNETNEASASRYPRLDWGNFEQQIIFAGGGIGGLIMSLPSGWLINRFGSRTTFATSLAISAVANMLIPVTSQYSYVGVAMLWIIVGTSTCLFFPFAYNVCSWWATKAEVGKALALSTSGMQVGRFVQILIAGVECKNIGWEWIFYISGISSLIFAAGWFSLFRDDPSDFKLITKAEVVHITESRQRKKTENQTSIPWIGLLSSLGIWSCILCRFAVITITRGVNQFVPTYNRDILKLRPEINGYTSSLPILSQLLARVIAGPLSDIKISNVTVRMKIINTISFVGTAAFCLGLSFVEYDSPKPLPVFLFCGVMFMVTLCTGGYMKAPLCMAPQYSAIIGSFMNVSGNIAALILPFIVDGIVVHKTLSEWATVFYIIAAASLLGAITFVIFGSGRKLKLAEEVPTAEVPYIPLDKHEPKDKHESNRSMNDEKIVETMKY